MTVPITIIIPTYNRPKSLESTLESFAKQNYQASEILIIDASTNDASKKVCQKKNESLSPDLIWCNANEKGAAAQRNQGYLKASQPFILFSDDDIYLEPDCIRLLWEAILMDEHIGGVNAMITNQKYVPLGRISRTMAVLLSGKNQISFAGKCIPPAWAMLPDDNEDLPDLVPVEWLNLGATIYRKAALPEPPFQGHFHGYSLMEDLTLSLKVGKKWKLYNVRKAKIFHDSQPGDYKSNIFVLSKMELVNRYYIMSNILEQKTFKAHLKFLVFQLFQIASNLNNKRGWRNVLFVIMGKISGIWAILIKK